MTKKTKNQRETVEEFLKRGGKIETLPAFECESEKRPVLIQRKPMTPIGYGCFWVLPSKGLS